MQEASCFHAGLFHISSWICACSVSRHPWLPTKQQTTKKKAKIINKFLHLFWAFEERSKSSPSYNLTELLFWLSQHVRFCLPQWSSAKAEDNWEKTPMGGRKPQKPASGKYTGGSMWYPNTILTMSMMHSVQHSSLYTLHESTHAKWRLFYHQGILCHMWVMPKTQQKRSRTPCCRSIQAFKLRTFIPFAFHILCTPFYTSTCLCFGVLSDICLVSILAQSYSVISNLTIEHENIIYLFLCASGCK